MPRLALLLILLSCLPGCPAPDDPDQGGNGVVLQGTLVDVPAPADASKAARQARLAAVSDFAYQLQGRPSLDLAPIRASAFDLVVIDYSADGSEAGEFTAQQIAALRAGVGRPKLVLAYMSIGEAEVGRFYFDPRWLRPSPETDPDGPFALAAFAPDFLDQPNPDFPDNLKVRFWDPLWQQVVVHNPGGHPVLADRPSYLDRILDAGFDGVYLDIIDAYEYFGPESIGGDGQAPDAAARMIDLVLAIARHARETRGRTDFLVFPQNGAAIIDLSSFPAESVPAGRVREEYVREKTNAYFAAIDGIGAEDTFHFGDADEDNPLAPQEGVIRLLDTYRSAGLAVLAIDYLTRAASIDDFYARCRERGWTPYCSVRALDRLTINPTQPPR